MAKVKGLNIPRREFRGLLVGDYGKPNEPGGEPWFGEGRFVQHLTPGLFDSIGFCGRSVSRTSSQPIRTLIGITCPGCIRVAKRIAKRIAADKKTAAVATEG
ncbi:hypothetical protein GCM10023063_16540 [Arthrobacter methylotrophus]|uniref:Uncharacterized protein n=1 Tax=Arthrobacter methylotrophus TaxID=121291 RepID=A0ABV5UNI2_9MICC